MYERCQEHCRTCDNPEVSRDREASLAAYNTLGARAMRVVTSGCTWLGRLVFLAVVVVWLAIQVLMTTGIDLLALLKGWVIPLD